MPSAAFRLPFIDMENEDRDTAEVDDDNDDETKFEVSRGRKGAIIPSAHTPPSITMRRWPHTSKGNIFPAEIRKRRHHDESGMPFIAAASSIDPECRALALCIF